MMTEEVKAELASPLCKGRDTVVIFGIEAHICVS